MNDTPYPYSADTDGVIVRVRPRYMAERSQPKKGQWVWAYDIEIINTSDATVQLRERDWTITDGNGRREHVHGPGVVGEQPILNTGDTFRYTSGCPLPTPSGFMEGFFTFADEAGTAFRVAVPTFALDLPDAGRRFN